MGKTLFTAGDCIRCKIAKRFMDEHGIEFVEIDTKAGGMDDFRIFYSAHRQMIHRAPNGIDFPILVDDGEIRQGLGIVAAYLQGGKKLDAFVRYGSLHREWVDGLRVSGGDPANAEDFLAVLRYLKANSMKLQVETTGKNSHILENILAENLADVMIMDVKGPKELYSSILGEAVDIKDVEKSIALVSRFPVYRFETMVAPITAGDGAVRYPTADEIEQTAKWVAEVTGSKKHPYLLKWFNPEKEAGGLPKSLELLPINGLIKYRTAARKYQVLADVERVG